MSIIFWLIVIIAAILVWRWLATGKAPWMWLLLAAFLPLAALVQAPAAAHAQANCMPVDLAAAMIEDAAGQIGAKVEVLADKGAVERYVAVIDEEPPPVGPVERLLIVVHPAGVAFVFPVHRELICMQINVAPPLHARAWRAARGDPA